MGWVGNVRRGQEAAANFAQTAWNASRRLVHAPRFHGGVLIGGAILGAALIARWSAIKERVRAESALQESTKNRERLTYALTAGHAGTFEWNARTNVNDWSDEMYELYGVRKGEFRGRYGDWLELVLPEYREAAQAAVMQSLKSGTFQYDFPIRRPCDGQIRWLSGSARVEFDLLGRATRIVGVNTDITDRKLAELSLQETQRRLQLSIEVAELGPWEYDVANDRLQVSSNWKKRLKLEHVGDTPAAWLAQIHPEDQEKTLHYFEGCFLRPDEPHHVEFRLYQGDGALRWISCRAIASKDERGRVVRVYGTHLDITHRKETERRIREESLHDPLTGLPNRALLSEYGGHLLSAAERGRGGCALLYVDLDRFKPINDLYGHDAGDVVLKEVAQRLRGCTRQGDVVARLGGDEFAVLLAHADAERRRADAVSHHILEAVSQPIPYGEVQLSISPSIGISYFPEQGKDIEGLIQKADLAMYDAKQKGRAGCQTYRDGLEMPAEEAATKMLWVRQAMESGNLELYYQPIVGLRDSRLVAAEALVRMSLNDGQIVEPAQFMPDVKAVGLDTVLDDWVLTAACRQQAAWEKEGWGVPVVSVNICPAQASKPEFPHKLETIVRDAGIDPERLQVEVSEAAFEREEEAVALVHRLKSVGVQVALDGFGQGTLRLRQLSELPIDRVKLEQGIARQGGLDPGVAAIPKLVIALGQILKFDVVWEGVDSEQMLQALRESGAGAVQGYLLGRPLPPQEFARWCHDGRFQLH